MCRNIRTLHNFAPPASDDEVRAAALQYVRTLSGSTLNALSTAAPARDRDTEAARARERSAKRFAKVPGKAPAEHGDPGR